MNPSWWYLLITSHIYLHSLFLWQFGSWIPTMCNRTSCAQVQESLWTYHGDNLECTLDLLITHIFTLVLLVAIWGLFQGNNSEFDTLISMRLSVENKAKLSNIYRNSVSFADRHLQLWCTSLWDLDKGASSDPTKNWANTFNNKRRTQKSGQQMHRRRPQSQTRCRWAYPDLRKMVSTDSNLRCSAKINFFS